MGFAEGAQTGKKTLDPALSSARGEHVGGEREGEERRKRAGSHGGDIAQAAGQGAVAYGLRRMQVAVEVASFQGKVRGDNDFMSFGQAEDGAVVADPKGDLAVAGRARSRADLFNQREFAHNFLHLESPA
jgi:hypothetical protein